MIYEVNVKLNEQEYAKLAAAAAKNGKQPEAFLHDMVEKLEPPAQAKHPMTGREFMELQYREGELINLPDPQQVTQEEEAEIERLGKLFAGGKPVSEMIIEDRGPY